jgi:hypothetical protein
MAVSRLFCNPSPSLEASALNICILRLPQTLGPYPNHIPGPFVFELWAPQSSKETPLSYSIILLPNYSPSVCADLCLASDIIYLYTFPGSVFPRLWLSLVGITKALLPQDPSDKARPGDSSRVWRGQL